MFKQILDTLFGSKGQVPGQQEDNMNNVLQQIVAKVSPTVTKHFSEQGIDMSDPQIQQLVNNLLSHSVGKITNHATSNVAQVAQTQTEGSNQALDVSQLFQGRPAEKMGDVFGSFFKQENLQKQLSSVGEGDLNNFLDQFHGVFRKVLPFVVTTTVGHISKVLGASSSDPAKSEQTIRSITEHLGSSLENSINRAKNPYGR
jgi:hypothetical protein